MNKSRTAEAEGIRNNEAPRYSKREAVSEEWRKIYEAFIASGSSARRYSQETGVSYHQFLYWSRKFRLEECEAASVGPREFRELGVLICREYRVRLRNGLELIFQGGSDCSEVREIVAALDGDARGSKRTKC